MRSGDADAYDILIGGEGEDWLFAEEGVAFIWGGAGSDRIVLNEGSTSLLMDYDPTTDRKIGVGGDVDAWQSTGKNELVIVQKDVTFSDGSTYWIYGMGSYGAQYEGALNPSHTTYVVSPVELSESVFDAGGSDNIRFFEEASPYRTWAGAGTDGFLDEYDDNKANPFYTPASGGVSQFGFDWGTTEEEAIQAYLLANSLEAIDTHEIEISGKALIALPYADESGATATATASADGSLILSGDDAWYEVSLEAINEDFEITTRFNMRLDFEASAGVAFAAVGFESNDRLTPDTHFQLTGAAQSGFRQDFNTYTQGDGTVAVEVPVGSFFPEASGPTADGWDRIVFSTDAPVSGSGTFSDIELWWDSIAFFDPAETNSGVTSNASYLDSDWLSLETKLGASVISNPNGLNGTTYNFDGSNDYLEIYDPGNDLVLGGSMSFVIDVLFDHKSQDWSKVFDFGAGRADSNLLLTQYSDTDDMRVEWWDYQGNRIGNLKVNDVIEPGTWMQLAVTITDEGHVSFYKNGALLKDQDFDPVPIESRPNLYIGKSHWSGDKYFEGQIGTFAIFDTALPGFAVQQMYDETSPMYDFL